MQSAPEFLQAQINDLKTAVGERVRTDRFEDYARYSDRRFDKVEDGMKADRRMIWGAFLLPLALAAMLILLQAVMPS